MLLALAALLLLLVHAQLTVLLMRHKKSVLSDRHHHVCLHAPYLYGFVKSSLTCRALNKSCIFWPF